MASINQSKITATFEELLSEQLAALFVDGEGEEDTETAGTITELVMSMFTESVDPVFAAVKQLKKDLAASKVTSKSKSKSKSGSGEKRKANDYSKFVSKVSTLKDGGNEEFGSMTVQTSTANFAKQDSKSCVRYLEHQDVLELDGRETTLREMFDTISGATEHDAKFGKDMVRAAIMWGLTPADQRKELVADM